MKAGVEGSVDSRGAAEPAKGAQLELPAAACTVGANDGQKEGLGLGLG